ARNGKGPDASGPCIVVGEARSGRRERLVGALLALLGLLLLHCLGRFLLLFLFLVQALAHRILLGAVRCPAAADGLHSMRQPVEYGSPPGDGRQAEVSRARNTSTVAKPSMAK